MGTGNIIIVVVALGLVAVLLHPKVTSWRLWRATVTPLASIIGSGFLVAGPILSHAAGHWAFAAILCLCGIAYFFGAAIRHNIAHIEPQLGDNPTRRVWLIEEASDLALALAYFVSVGYYLNLFAAFMLRGGGVVDEFWIKVAASAVIGGLGVVGTLKGLGALERLETRAVGVKLALIGGLLAALAVLSGMAVADGSLGWPDLNHTRGWKEVQVLLGLVILVQGFETSRYLGEEYDGKTRIRTMRWAQWLATAIYLVFILLVTRYFTDGLPEKGGETAIIDLLRPVGMLAGPAIILMALSSQLSAAVADMNGAGGLLAQTAGIRISVKVGYALTAIAAIAITWVADIYQIITYASKAFVLYYGLQALQAALSCWGQGKKAHALFYGSGVILTIVIIVFAIPAEA